MLGTQENTKCGSFIKESKVNCANKQESNFGGADTMLLLLLQSILQHQESKCQDT